MTESPISHIISRENPLIKEIVRLRRDPGAYRKSARIWLEGDHLCRASLARGSQPAVAVFATSYWPNVPAEWWHGAGKVVVVPDAVFADLSHLESPAGMGYLLDLPERPELQSTAASVILDRVQDAGNVGSILRSACAFGFTQILAMKGTAAMWSPKVLRAGMGAHFGLQLIEGLDDGVLDTLAIPLVVTSSHKGDLIQSLRLPSPCAWVMGHEGQGVSAALMDKAQVFVSIGQPGGEESLNVAAAAAICLHASSVAGRGSVIISP